ncbi:MBL fold metallo-hydrolase [candidate division KSB3 bacterium]|uniref:MBL fold metallo-hydrolase n=1 Tax=candidate division KSB3 bacterium TaxID=2044937 RepID=A0A2G6KBS9_9BACT|nr:MAG: MBL fold metallo-hydrolase [candidate division KSB3 bacterium]
MDLTCEITTIDTGFVRPGFDASHLIVEGGEAAFVDVGVSHSVPVLREALKQHQVAPENVKYLILTHIHLDHAGGAGVFLQELPNAQVVVHPKGARHLIKPERLIQGSMAVYGEERFRTYFGEVLPIPAERVIEAHHEDRLSLNGRELEFLDTPGHARHHVCVVDEKSRGIFTGDTFGLSYRDFDTLNGPFIFPATAPVHFDPENMHETIDLLISYQPKKMYLTHFGCVEGVSRLADEMHELIDLFAAVAQRVDGMNDEQRHLSLIEEITQLLVVRLKTHGCTLPEERITELLLTDITLNAQGLTVWLDRNRPKQAS